MAVRERAASPRAAEAAAGSGGAVWKSAFPTFTKHTIASFSDGYMTFTADIDRDGLPDVVALSLGADGLVWFKNPSWKRYTITTRAKNLIFAAAYDVDGDGDLDLAIASDFDTNNTTSGGTISWAEAPDDPTQSQDWTLRKIDATPCSHRMRWGDIDGDGRKELLVLPIFGQGSTAPAHTGAVQFKAYSIPKDAKAANAAWTSQVIDDQHLEVAHDVEVVDWDGDKAVRHSDGCQRRRGFVPPLAGQRGRAPRDGRHRGRRRTEARARWAWAISAARASSPPSSPGMEPMPSSTRRARPHPRCGRDSPSAPTSSTDTGWPWPI